MEDSANNPWPVDSLWEAWYNDELNWRNLNLGILDESEAPPNLNSHKDSNTGEIIDQDWPLRDPNEFYYPLFGLGQTESRVAVVAAGPGHNIESPWKEYSEYGEYREAFRGPKRAEKDWYAPGFDVQKQDWTCVRKNKPTDLVRNLRKIHNELPNNDDSVFDYFYYTNFMKDGEFHKDSRSSSYDLEENELWDAVDESGKIFYKEHPSHLIRPRWPKYNQYTTKPTKVCELASREFWLPVLGAELAGVSPNVVVPMGKKATLGVFKLYEIQQGWSSEVVLEPFRKSEAGVTIIPSYHWSNLERNITNIEDRYPEVTKNNYLEILAEQIAEEIHKN